MTKVFSEKDEYGIYWYNNGTRILHREDGPAIKYYNGDKIWYQNGKKHRIDGPAVEYTNGNKFWYQNGLRHREDGPAIEYINGRKYYYLNGEHYLNIQTNEEWIIFQIIN